MKELAASTTRDAATRALLAQLYAYLLQVVREEDAASASTVYSKVLEIAGPEGKEDVVTAAEKLINQGRAEGEARGEARGRAIAAAQHVLAVLQARGFVVSETQRERVLGCSDVVLLETWLVRAVTVATVGELLD